MEKKHLYACLITLISAPSGAYQKVVVTDSKPMPEVIISNKQMNRIQVEGLRIQNVTAPDDTFDIEGNNETGVVYLRLLDAEKKGPFAISLVSEKKDHFDLLVTPQDVPMEVIHVKKEGGESLRTIPDTWTPGSGKTNGKDPKDKLQDILKMGWQGKGHPISYPKAFYEYQDEHMEAKVRGFYRIFGHSVAVLNFKPLVHHKLDSQKIINSLKHRAIAIMYAKRGGVLKVVLILTPREERILS